jgi:hypothetical protein
MPKMARLRPGVGTNRMKQAVLAKTKRDMLQRTLYNVAAVMYLEAYLVEPA